MTQEQQHQAKDILTTLLSFDCQGLKCDQCPFSDDSNMCMISTMATTAHIKLKRMRAKAALNSLYGKTVTDRYAIYSDTDSCKQCMKGE